MEAAMWRDMNMSMNGMAPSWTPIDAALVFAMWTAMMAAMMLPGAGADGRRLRRPSTGGGASAARPMCRPPIFLLGYLAVWAGFSVVATALQWLLQTSGLLTTMMQSASLSIGPPRCSSPPASTSSARSRSDASPIAARPTASS